MNIRTIPEPEAILADGTVKLTSEWDTGNVLIKGPSAIYTSSTAPLSPYTGMLWNDTSIASRQMIKKWNGSAWVAVAGYEASSRTISLIHDHGSEITNTFITTLFNHEIARVGAATITIEIDNKTHKTFAAGAAVDAGGGLVKLPLASGHGFLAGERVCIDGTVNYDGVFVINSVEETYIIISATYVAETIPADAVVRVVIRNVGTFSSNMNPITITAKDYVVGCHQKQRVVFYNDLSYARPPFSGLLRESYVRGIKFYTESSVGIQINTCLSLCVEYCSVTGNASYNALSVSWGSFVRANCLCVENAHAAVASFFGSTVLSNECSTVSNVKYGLFADLGGTIKKTSVNQPTGSIANEFANTSKGAQII